MKEYKIHQDYHANENSIIDIIDISKFIDTAKYPLSKAWINVGGWQSWNPGFEIEPEKKQPALNTFINGWKQYLRRIMVNYDKLLGLIWRVQWQ